MNPSNPKLSSIVPKCLKPEDPETEIFLRNHDLLEGFMSDVKDSDGVYLEEIDDTLQDMIELIQNLVASLDASENWKEISFWQSQIVRLERDVQFHSRTAMMYSCYRYLSNDLEDIERAKSEAVAFKMVAGLDSKGFEKMKGYLKDVNNEKYWHETEGTDNAILFAHEDKLNETSDDDDENEETLGIPQESSCMGSASSVIFFPDGCGSVAERRPGSNKKPAEIDDT